jgi:nickel-dependent lactate racemase
MPDERGAGVKVPDIIEAREAAAEFLKKNLKVKEAKVVKAVRAGAGWEVEAEVYEESSFMKSLGLATKVQDKNIYALKLSESLEVESFEKNK